MINIPKPGQLSQSGVTAPPSPSSPMSKSYQLLTLAVEEYAPSSDVAVAMVRRYNEMLTWGQDSSLEDELSIALASMIIDGLRHSNWPT